jgi:hypothetical protein
MLVKPFEYFRGVAEVNNASGNKPTQQQQQQPQPNGSSNNANGGHAGSDLNVPELGSLSFFRFVDTVCVHTVTVLYCV